MFISSICQLLTTAAVEASDTKLVEHILAPFAVFTNFGSNLNGNGLDDEAEGFSNS